MVNTKIAGASISRGGRSPVMQERRNTRTIAIHADLEENINQQRHRALGPMLTHVGEHKTQSVEGKVSESTSGRKGVSQNFGSDRCSAKTSAQVAPAWARPHDQRLGDLARQSNLNTKRMTFIRSVYQELYTI